MRDQPRISVAVGHMSEERPQPDGNNADHTSVNPSESNPSDPQEKIRQLEEKIRRLEEANDRLENENNVFRKVLRTAGVDIEKLLEENKELQFRVSMNSTNSSKPPSSDGYMKPKPKSLKVVTGRRPGGQPGHAGHHMVIPHEADQFVDHLPDRCVGCSKRDECISNGALRCGEKRHVVDVVTRTFVTEHRRFVAKCPMADVTSDAPVSGAFPEGVSAYVQYGNGVKVFVSALDTYGAMSDSRISTLTRELFDISLSPGTVVSMTKEFAENVNDTMEQVRRSIIGSDVANFDETGIRVGGKLYWAHTSSTPLYTYQTVSTKRGKEGIDHNGVLGEFEGNAVHDCFTPYDGYINAKHSHCCAHLLRELNGIDDLEPGRFWPTAFRHLLLDMKSARDAADEQGLTTLDRHTTRRFETVFDRILEMADMECPPRPHTGKRGRPKKGRERSLIERLRKKKEQICRFMYDFRVPFDNNLAERDLRNIKTKVKVSGSFRSSECAQDYLTNMSYLSTARKRGINAIQSLKLAFSGRSDAILNG